ncbi:MAG: hypothetical protein L3J39_02215 [Verrucomicrobiales bacterium]|nr:hypothetical protein [Verrucomicrobiales bacterium]
MKTPSFIALTALSLISLTAISCASKSEPPEVELLKTDDSLAALEVRNVTELDIRRAVVETFLTNGYQRDNTYSLTFSKKGNIVRQIEYASYMGGAARMKVAVRIQPMSASSFLIKINANTVTHQNSSFGAHKKKVRGLRKGHYRNLLRDINNRLGQY